jgi:two-component system, sensor histidine kinase PdtaS
MKDNDKSKIELIDELERLREKCKKFDTNQIQFQADDKAINEIDELSSILINKMLDAVVIIDFNGIILYYNKTAADLVGYENESITGHNVMEFVHPDYRRAVLDHVELVKVDKGGFFGEYKILSKKGDEKWVEGLGTKITFKGKSANIVNLRDITQRKKTEKALHERDVLLNNLLHASPIPTFVINLNHEVIYWNKALEKYSDIKTEEIIGTKNHWKAFYGHKRPCLVDLLVEDDIEEINKWYGEWAKSKLVDDAYEATDFFQEIGENGTWLYFTASTIKDSPGDIVGAVETLEDINDSKVAEEQIKESLKEKVLLLREIHHRVKNNLQIISSLLGLQSHCIEDKNTIELLKDSQNRVKSMALLHEKLYASESLARIDIHDYIMTLVNHLNSVYGEVPARVDMKLDIEDILLEVDTAIPCGLVINELVSNSLKHAFPNERTGKIGINLRSEDNDYILTVKDDGVGIPEEIDFENTQTLGLRLVKILVEQLNGTIELTKYRGTIFKIFFTI